MLLTKNLRLKFICALLIGTLLCGILLSSVSAVDTTADLSEETEATPEAEQATLSITDIKNLAEIVVQAKADSKAEDTRTPRDKLTAAYLESDMGAARAAIKQANDAYSKPVSVDYDGLTIADISALIEAMKIEVDMEPPSGFFASIQLAAGSILNWFTHVLGGGNYIIGIVIFALVIELVMMPLAIKQQKNSIRQAHLKPKEAAIRKKYAGREDKVTKNKINTEIQELYQKEGYNPAAGCLPMLIQLPIIFILYYVVINPIVYVMKLSSGISDALLTFVNTSAAAGGLGQASGATRGTIQIASLIEDNPEFIDRLSKFQYFANSQEIANAVQNAPRPNFNFFGLNFGLVPDISNPDWLLIIPVLTFAVYFLSMKLTKKLTIQPTTDQGVGCSNNIMDIGMPAFSAYICFVVPAALGFYWTIKSVFSTLSRIALSKIMPLPKFSEEDYKAAEKEIIKGKGGARGGAYKRSTQGNAVRSLHRIDDEDFEDTRARAEKQRAKLEEAQKEAEKEVENKDENKVEKAEENNLKNEDDRPMLTMKEMIKNRRNKKYSVRAEKKEDADKTSKINRKENNKDTEDK